MTGAVLVLGPSASAHPLFTQGDRQKLEVLWCGAVHGGHGGGGEFKAVQAGMNPAAHLFALRVLDYHDLPPSTLVLIHADDEMDLDPVRGEYPNTEIVEVRVDADVYAAHQFVELARASIARGSSDRA